MSPPLRGQPCRGSRDNRQSATVSSTTCFSGAQFELATLHLSATHQVLNFTLRCNSDMLQKFTDSHIEAVFIELGGHDCSPGLTGEVYHEARQDQIFGIQLASPPTSPQSDCLNARSRGQEADRGAGQHNEARDRTQADRSVWGVKLFAIERAAGRWGADAESTSRRAPSVGVLSLLSYTPPVKERSEIEPSGRAGWIHELYTRTTSAIAHRFR